MPSRSRDIATQTFSSPGWQAAANALFQATGVTVHAMDFAVGDTLSSESRCAFCSLSGGSGVPSPHACFGDSIVTPGPDVTRAVCRSGLPTLVAAVEVDNRVVGSLVLGGFVTSTRERRRLNEQLIGRGISEDSARLKLKSLALVPRHQAEGYLQVALASARAMLDATSERRTSSDRVEELKLFVSAGQHVVETERLDEVALGAIAEEAVALVGGEAGAVLRQGGNLLEVVARTEFWRGQTGVLVPMDGTASGRAITTGRTVVSGGAAATQSATLALPLTIGQRVLGVLEVRLPAGALPVAPERVARLDRFGRFIAIALERDDERALVERAAAGYAQLNELAATLGGQTDMDGVAKIVTGALDKAFTYDVAGLILTSYGRDRADVVVCGDVTSGELDLLLGEAAGRDAVAEPFETLRTVTHGGVVSDGGIGRDDWATAVVELSHGGLELGYLLLARADGARYNVQDRLLLEGIAAHAGAAIGRAALFGRIRDDYAKTIAALSATLDAGERMPSGHSSRVMGYAMMIGEELGLGYEDVEQLRFAGLLHDIGKTGLPGEILLKPSRLSAEELAQVHAHAEIGASIVDQIEFLKSLTPIILHHHEHWDGSGYPIGLAGDDIPLLARILCVADSFDAMTTKSSYKKRMSFATARHELEINVGKHFDPRIVAALLEALDSQALAGATGLLVAPESGARTDLPA